MNTKIISIEEGNASKEALKEAGEIIKNGGLVAFPTETVYGLGGNALDETASEKIYRAKGRPSDNPLIVHICRIEDIFPIVEEVPETAKKLADAFWPGPLTMILKKSEKVPDTTLAFIAAAGGYVAAPSANISGKPSPTLAKYVTEDMGGRIEMIIDGGEIAIGIESTIVDLTEEIPVILRPGYITREMLEEVLGKVDVDRAILEAGSKQAPKAPGMKYKHYAPQGDLTIISGSQENVVAEINKRCEEMKKRGEKVGVIGTDSTVPLYRAESVKNAGTRGEEAAIARALYRILREFDDEGVTVIYSEAFEGETGSGGIGQAIMNRLLKAAGYHIEQV